jgi:glycine/D-amino acid oxidase-like deaminating enzyme
MNNGSLKYFDSPPHSYWMASTSETNYPQLTEDITIDTVVIGGGMAGILCAYLLQKEGINTTILEAERIVQGTTAHTTAKITSQHGIIYDKIKKQRGFELAKQYADANEYAIHEIKNIARENQIDCDYIPQSAYIYTQQEKNIKKLENEAKTASELGINASFINKMPLPIPVKAAVRFDGQAQFHPRKFLLPIAEKINGNGVSIYEKSRAVDLEYGDKITITTAEGKKVTANKAIIASHYPFYNKHGMYYSRIYTERTYIIAVTTKEKYPGGMYVNAEDPSRSVRYQPFKNGELILVVGQNHKTGQGSDMAKNYYILRNFADDLFTIEEIHYRWSTQDCMTLDGVPYVGVYQKDMPNLYIATGFEKWGMTNSMVSAAIIKIKLLFRV